MTTDEKVKKIIKMGYTIKHIIGFDGRRASKAIKLNKSDREFVIRGRDREDAIDYLYPLVVSCERRDSDQIGRLIDDDRLREIYDKAIDKTNAAYSSPEEAASMAHEIINSRSALTMQQSSLERRQTLIEAQRTSLVNIRQFIREYDEVGRNIDDVLNDIVREIENDTMP